MSPICVNTDAPNLGVQMKPPRKGVTTRRGMVSIIWPWRMINQDSYLPVEYISIERVTSLTFTLDLLAKAGWNIAISCFGPGPKGRSFEPLGHPFHDLLSQMSCFCKLVYEIDAKFSQNRGLQTPTQNFLHPWRRLLEYGQEQKERETSLSTFKRCGVKVVGSYDRIKIYQISKHHGNLCKSIRCVPTMTCTIMYSDIPKFFYQVGSKQGWGPILWLCSCQIPVFLGDVDLNASGKSTFLVATDVAARGLDIPKVGLKKPRDDSPWYLSNFNPPAEPTEVSFCRCQHIEIW